MAMKYMSLIIVLFVVLMTTQGTLIGKLAGSVLVTLESEITIPSDFLASSLQGDVLKGAMGVFITLPSSVFISLEDIFDFEIISTINTLGVDHTPLTICNASLSSTETLQAPIRILGSTFSVNLNITNAIAGPFRCINYV
ncbi:hypothetical protein R6Q59_021817 [Mikania micrantha]